MYQLIILFILYKLFYRKEHYEKIDLKPFNIESAVMNHQNLWNEEQINDEIKRLRYELLLAKHGRKRVLRMRIQELMTMKNMKYPYYRNE